MLLIVVIGCLLRYVLIEGRGFEWLLLLFDVMLCI